MRKMGSNVITACFSLINAVSDMICVVVHLHVREIMQHLFEYRKMLLLWPWVATIAARMAILTTCEIV